MPNSNNVIEIVRERWSYFSALLFQKIKNLYLEKNKIEIEIKKIEKILKVIKYSQKDIEFLLTHKETFIELDNTLAQSFTIIEAFKKRNALDNGALNVYFTQIFNSPKIIELSDKVNNLNYQKVIIENKIEELEDLKNERTFSDELIKEIAKKYNLDNITEKYLRIYPVLKSKKHKLVEKKEPKEEKDDLNKVTSESIINQIEVLEQDNQNPNEIVEQDNTEYFNDVIKFYEQLFESNKELINKYYGIILNMKEHEKQYYSYYVDSEEFDNNQITDDNKETIAKTYALKLFKLKEEINDNILIIKNDNYQEKEYIQYLEEIIKDFNNYLNNLKYTDELIEKDMDNGLKDVSNVYFLLDDSGEIMVPEDTDNFIQIYSKLAEFTEIDNLIKKDPFVIKESTEELGRTTLAQRMNNTAFAYIKVKTGLGTTGTGILVIGLSSITKGAFNKIKNSTNKLTTKHKELIQQQIKLIEERDLNYLINQEKERKKLKEFSKRGDKNARKHG